MYKLNLIAIVGIVVAVSLVVGMAAPAAFATQGIMTTPMGDNTTTTMGNNTSSTGNVTGGSNATSMAETESLPSANQTVCANCSYCQSNTC